MQHGGGINYHWNEKTRPVQDQCHRHHGCHHDRDPSTFSTYEIEACYDFHRYSLKAVRHHRTGRNRRARSRLRDSAHQESTNVSGSTPFDLRRHPLRAGQPAADQLEPHCIQWPLAVTQPGPIAGDPDRQRADGELPRLRAAASTDPRLPRPVCRQHHRAPEAGTHLRYRVATPGPALEPASNPSTRATTVFQFVHAAFAFRP